MHTVKETIDQFTQYMAALGEAGYLPVEIDSQEDRYLNRCCLEALSSSYEASEETQSCTTEEIDLSLPIYQTAMNQIQKEIESLNLTYKLNGNVLEVNGLQSGLQELQIYLSRLYMVAKKPLYPKYWNFGASLYETISLVQESEEFGMVSAMIRKTMPNVDIVKVKRIQNQILMNKYLDALIMNQKLQQSNRNDRKLLFHGTQTVLPETVYGYEGTGFGTDYTKISSRLKLSPQFMREAKKAYSDYAHHLPNQNLQILIADVFTGSSEANNVMKTDKSTTTKSAEEHSDHHIVCKDFHSYPLYLVEISLDKRNKKGKDFTKSESPIFSPTALVGRVKPSSSTLKVIQRQLAQIRDDKSLEYLSIHFPFIDDISEWIVTVSGPPETGYEGGIFRTRILFTDDYPVKPPRVEFLTKIYHPSVGFDGSICLGLINQWQPGINVAQILLMIYVMLTDPLAEEALVSDILKLYQDNTALYTKKAQEWTSRFAI